MNTTVSVYIPTHNRLELLKRAIASVTAQTYEDWELLVVNDNSSDDTYQYLESIKSDKIKVFHQSFSQGACVARNLAIQNASGNFITGLDDDDYFEPKRLAKFVETWKVKKKGVVFLFSGQQELKLDQLYVGRHLNFSIVEQKDMLMGNFVGNQIFTTKQYFFAIEGFDKNLKMWQDFDCWYRLLRLGNGEYVDNTSYIFDVNDRNDRITKKKKQVVLETMNYLSEKYSLTYLQRRCFRLHLVYYGFYKKNLFFKIKVLIWSLLMGNFTKIYLTKVI